MKISCQTRNPRRQAGFTLLEMVIVLGIIAVIIGGSIAVLGRVGDGAKLQRVSGDFLNIGSSLRTYEMNAGCFPTTQQGLAALVKKPTSNPLPKRYLPLADSVPMDPWGAEYGYRYPGKSDKAPFEIISAGPDRQMGTSDDISSHD